MSETMHRRDLDVDKRMVDLMTTVQDLTLRVKAVVATVPSRPSPVPVALNPASISFTIASPPQQPTYKEVPQRQSGSKPYRAAKVATTRNVQEVTRKNSSRNS